MQKPTHILIALILLAFAALQGHAQQITNILVSQQSDKLHISYNLTSPNAGDKFGISVKASTDGGRTFTVTPKTLSGALKNVSPGNNQQIVWDVLNDMEKLASDNMVFELEAVMVFETKAFRKPLVKMVDYHVSSQNSGTLEKRRPFDFQVLVQNIGQGIAHDVVVKMAIPTNVFCLTANEEVFIGTLEPGDRSLVNYSLLTNALYNLPKIVFDFKLDERYGKLRCRYFNNPLHEPAGFGRETVSTRCNTRKYRNCIA